METVLTGIIGTLCIHAITGVIIWAMLDACLPGDGYINEVYIKKKDYLGASQPSPFKRFTVLLILGPVAWISYFCISFIKWVSTQEK